MPVMKGNGVRPIYKGKFCRQSFVGSLVRMAKASVVDVSAVAHLKSFASAHGMVHGSR